MTVKLVENSITSIVYESSKQVTSARMILPTSIPKTTVTAIDLSEVDIDMRQHIQQLAEQYSEYKRNFLASMFNFETWVEHTTGETLNLKWRSFTLDKIQGA